MLYISTRNKVETFTAFRVLREMGAPEGGTFVPFQLKPLQSGVLQKIYRNGFHNAVAEILNMFFSTKLTAWDVELSVGRNVIACRQLGHKLTVAELWHNPTNDYKYLEQALYRKLAGISAAVPYWVRIAIRTAVLFGMYSQLYGSGIHSFDIAVNAADHISLLAAYFARKIGLPVEKIIVGCDETSGMWELFHKAYIPASSSASTELEVLIYAELGNPEAARFRAQQESGRSYKLDGELHEILCDGFFASVVGVHRTDGIISSFRKNDNYDLCRQAAVSYSALQDYRAKTGESKTTILLADLVN